jgi:hypothetical protein
VRTFTLRVSSRRAKIDNFQTPSGREYDLFIAQILAAGGGAGDAADVQGCGEPLFSNTDGTCNRNVQLAFPIL